LTWVRRAGGDLRFARPDADALPNAVTSSGRLLSRNYPATDILKGLAALDGTQMRVSR
jgi:hypothetical protein